MYIPTEQLKGIFWTVLFIWIGFSVIRHLFLNPDKIKGYAKTSFQIIIGLIGLGAFAHFVYGLYHDWNVWISGITLIICGVISVFYEDEKETESN